MTFNEALTGLWDAWVVLKYWIPFWDPWGAMATAFVGLYALGRLVREQQGSHT